MDFIAPLVMEWPRNLSGPLLFFASCGLAENLKLENLVADGMRYKLTQVGTARHDSLLRKLWEPACDDLR